MKDCFWRVLGALVQTSFQAAPRKSRAYLLSFTPTFTAETHSGGRLSLRPPRTSVNQDYCEASEQLLVNQRRGPGSTGVRPAPQSLPRIHFLGKGPLPLSYRSPWRSGRVGVSRGVGMGGAEQTPLAAHSVVINEPPTGTELQLAGEPQEQSCSAASEGKGHGQETSARDAAETGQDAGCYGCRSVTERRERRNVTGRGGQTGSLGGGTSGGEEPLGPPPCSHQSFSCGGESVCERSPPSPTLLIPLASELSSGWFGWCLFC